jgi:hypothetical protein
MRNIMKTKVFDNRYKNDTFKCGHPVNDEHKPTWMRSITPSVTSTVSNGANRYTTANSTGLCVPSRLASPLKYSTICSVETRPLHALTARPTRSIDGASSYELVTNVTSTPRSFAVIWDHDLETEYMRSTIKRAMSRAQSKDVDPPSELQKLRKDPRQMTEEPMLYEQIRV